MNSGSSHSCLHSQHPTSMSRGIGNSNPDTPRSSSDSQPEKVEVLRKKKLMRDLSVQDTGQREDISVMD